MAKLTRAELKKRDNKNVLLKRLQSNGNIKYLDDNSPFFKLTGKIKLDDKVINKPLMEDIQYYVDNTSVKLFLETIHEVNKSKKYFNITQVFKDKEFGGAPGKSTARGSERQELGLIEVINNYILQYDEIYIDGIRDAIIKAKKNETEFKHKKGKEPYIDVILVTKNGKKFGVSCKGLEAPSLAGGGVDGLLMISDKLVKDLYDKIKLNLEKDGHYEGNIVSINDLQEYYYPIPNKYIDMVLRGTKDMGGPIDYMYIGPPMDVKIVKFKENTKTISLNGNFIDIDSYTKKIDKFYIRVRRRDIEPSKTTKIDFSKNNRTGLPKVFVGPSTNKNNIRLVIEKKVPSTGKII